MLVAGGALLCACDPPFRLEGRVVDSAGQPVGGITVRLSCDGVAQFSTVTEANGAYASGGIGWYPDTCVVQALRGSFVLAVLPLMPACTKSHGDHACMTVHAEIRLP
jgi:hypothetical protein